MTITCSVCGDVLSTNADKKTCACGGIILETDNGAMRITYNTDKPPTLDHKKETS